MKIFVFFIFFISLNSTLFANDLRYPESVVWGVYCGECVVNCSTLRKIDPTILKIDKSDRFFDSTNPFDYEFTGNVEPISEHEKYKWILEEPVPAIMKSETEIFGSPDGYDQCGFYLSYVVGKNTYKALVDPDKVPGDLAHLTSKLFNR